MKVIIANYRYFLAGGPERYMFNFIKLAEEHGIECIPFSVDYSANNPTKYSKYFAKARGGRDNVKFSTIKLTPANIIGLLNSTIYNFDAEKKLRKLIRKEKPDAVYILHEINSLSPSIIRAAKKEHVRVVHRISDFFMMCPRLDFLCGDDVCEACKLGDYGKALKNRCVKNSLPATLVRVLAMKLYRRMKIFSQVDAFITTCDFTRNKLIEGGYDPKKITTIPTFTEIDSIVPNYSNNGYVLFLGRVTQQKGTKYAVDAMKYLKDTHVRLKITGDLLEDEENKEIRKIIESEKLTNVDFVGFKHGSELQDLIDNAICIVNPAIWYENMPNTVIEAFAHGKPVIASNIGSLAELVEDGENGFLFETKNSFDLAQKIRRFVDDENLAATMGKNARKICEDKYNKEKHFQKAIKIICPSQDGKMKSGM